MNIESSIVSFRICTHPRRTNIKCQQIFENIRSKTTVSKEENSPNTFKSSLISEIFQILTTRSARSPRPLTSNGRLNSAAATSYGEVRGGIKISLTAFENSRAPAEDAKNSVPKEVRSRNKYQFERNGSVGDVWYRSWVGTREVSFVTGRKSYESESASGPRRGAKRDYSCQRPVRSDCFGSQTSLDAIPFVVVLRAGFRLSFSTPTPTVLGAVSAGQAKRRCRRKSRNRILAALSGPVLLSRFFHSPKHPSGLSSSGATL